MAADRIDFRSDFLARRTPRMIAAMREAEGDFHFGLREDPYQQALERRAADLLGHEDALVVPTCTMANEIAIMMHTRPGDTVLAPWDAHVITSEAGGPAALAGVMLHGLPHEGGLPALSTWADAAHGRTDAQGSRASLFVLENTHNRSGGMPLATDEVDAVLALAKSENARTHLDGARLLNAATALALTPRRLAQGFDTVALSLNKGLGAPIGAVLAGPRPLIERALVVRQQLGGGIRPTGPACAASLMALDEIGDLADDHRRASELAVAISQVPNLRVDLGKVRTNIVLAEVATGSDGAEAFCAALAAAGVLAMPMGRRIVRFTTYRGIADEDIARTAEIIRSVARTLG